MAYNEVIHAAYNKFVTECCGNNVHKCVIENAKKGRSRINLLIFDVKDKVPGYNIPYYALVYGTMSNKKIIDNYWIYQIEKSNLEPIIDKIDKELEATAGGYTLRIYKFWIKKWAIELEWKEDPKHNMKIKNYIEKYGSPY